MINVRKDYHRQVVKARGWFSNFGKCPGCGGRVATACGSSGYGSNDGSYLSVSCAAGACDVHIGLSFIEHSAKQIIDILKSEMYKKHQNNIVKRLRG